MQKDGLQAFHAAGLEIDGVAVQVEHGVGRIGLGAKAVVGQHPKAAVWHFLDARVALQRLSLERYRHACGAAGRQAFNRAQCVSAFRRSELAADLQVLRCVLRCLYERLGRHHDMACQRGWVGGLRVRWQGRHCCKGDATEGRAEGQAHSGILCCCRTPWCAGDVTLLLQGRTGFSSATATPRARRHRLRPAWPAQRPALPASGSASSAPCP